MNTFFFNIPSKLKRFFWSRGFLKFCLWVATLVVLFYVEENWRGARAWAKAKTEWEAKGETLDLARLLPHIPDSQNLANIPLFKMEPDPEKPGKMAPLALYRAYRSQSSIILPSIGPWQETEPPNLGKIQLAVRQLYLESFRHEPPPGMTTLTQFDAIYPVVADLREAAARRPSCRFDFDPNTSLYLITGQIQVANVLAIHTVLALDAGKPEVALADLKTSFRFIAGARQTPYYVSSLVAIGMTAITLRSFYDGLTRHAWNDSQLRELQGEWSRADTLSGAVYALRTEFIFYENMMSSTKSWPIFWPAGWIDLQRAQSPGKYLSAIQWIDLSNRRLTRPVTSMSPETLFQLDTYGPLTPLVLKSCQAQTWADQAQIACALERYRLAHGSCPPALADLVPSYMEKLPHDVITGEPFHYRLRPDRKFLLYSVGWNGKDDGGHVAYQTDSPKIREPKEGDWVWPVPR